MNFETFIISEEERKNMPFKLFGQLKVIDLQKAVPLMKKEREKLGIGMKVSLIPIREDKFKEPNYGFSWTKDPITGIYYGIPISVLSDGNPKWRRIICGESLPLDLTREDEAIQWTVLRMWDKIEGSPYQGADPIYRIFDPMQEAEKEDLRAEHIDQSLSLIKEMTAKRKVTFGRYLGIKMDQDTNLYILTSDLKKHAINEPADFMKKFHDARRGMREILESAMYLSVIKHMPQRGYMFRDINLGLTKDAILKYFADYPDVCESINQDCIAADSIMTKLVVEENENMKKNKKTPINDDL